MRQLFLLLLTFYGIAVHCFSQSQEWAPIGAVWHFQEDDWLSSEYSSYVTITVVGDTLIHGKPCRIMKKSGRNCADRELEDYTYYEEGVVYWYNKYVDQFTVLYDFNAQAGDQWEILMEDCSAQVSVVSTDTEVINGEVLKVLNMSFDGPLGGKITERLGHQPYLFPRIRLSGWCHIICDGRYSNGLRCYQDAQLGLYETGLAENCETVISSIEKGIPQQELLVYPNPASDWIEVKFSPFHPGELSIFDYKGNLVKQFSLNSAGQAIDIFSLSPGYYFLRLLAGNESPLLKKLFIY
ncbi:MAG: T9SS type A sorting domain-containing protein [Lewinellaceae bacterium]|nr:T9SS type A sorting domain-containing protein [Lewinellaceae bacterium]